MNPDRNLRSQFAEMALEVGQDDDRLVVIVGDISSGLMKPFSETCKGRFFNVGTMEPTMISLSAGMAKVGLKPVVHTIAPFLIERAFEQIKLDFCYHELGGNIVAIGAGFDYSNLGSTHHCYNDFALLKTLPNTQITYPASPLEFDVLFKETYSNDKVTYFRLPAKAHSFDFDASSIELGKGIRASEGDDLTVVVTGPQLDNATSIGSILAEEGKSCDILYLPTIRPLDEDLIRSSAVKTRSVVVIEEHMRSGGLGEDILRVIYNIDGIRFYSASIPDQFVAGYGTYHELRRRVGLTSEQILQAIQSRGLLN